MPSVNAPNTKSVSGKPLKGATGLTCNQVIVSLPQLNKQELKAIQAAIEHELLKDSVIDTDLFRLVFDVVGEKPMSISKFYSSENGITWRKNQPVFDDFFKVLLGEGAVHRVTLNAYKKFLVQLIVDYIKDKSMPLTIRVVSQQLGNIKAITNCAFPGYIENGAGHLILSQLKQR